MRESGCRLQRRNAYAAHARFDDMSLITSRDRYRCPADADTHSLLAVSYSEQPARGTASQAQYMCHPAAHDRWRLGTILDPATRGEESAPHGAQRLWRRSGTPHLSVNTGYASGPWGAGESLSCLQSRRHRRPRGCGASACPRSTGS